MRGREVEGTPSPRRGGRVMTQTSLTWSRRGQSRPRFQFYTRNYPKRSRCGSDYCRIALDLKRGTSFLKSGTSFDDFITHNILHMLPGVTPDWKSTSTSTQDVSMKRFTARSKSCQTPSDTDLLRLVHVLLFHHVLYLYNSWLGLTKATLT
jgi:hypothetical protein